MTNNKHVGADPGVWFDLDFIHGVGEDLVPVVADTSTKISPNSKLGTLGKTPSQLNGQGEAVGIPGWAKGTATPEQLDKWAKDPRLSAGVIGRRIRAIDVDITDQALADKIYARIEERYPEVAKAKRYRDNSSKFLLALRISGDPELAKRKIVTDGGIIEFLANNQFFVVSGQHTSGSRYEWLGGFPADFPTLELEEFEALWADLGEQFANTDWKVKEYKSRRTDADLGIHDPVVDFLESHGLVLSTRSDGAIEVECPWEHEHTTPTKQFDALYFPAGTRGYSTGSYKCLHGHCEDRSVNDFLNAIGYHADAFETLPAEVAAAAQEAPAALANRLLGQLPRYPHTKSGMGINEGKLIAAAPSLQAVFAVPQVLGFDIALDEFKDEIVLREGSTWRQFRDDDYFRLKVHLEAVLGFADVKKELIRDAVHFRARSNSIDTARLWLGSLKWDGVDRVTHLMRDYFGTEDSEYATSMGRYLATAMAGRVWQPGVKADIAVILTGAQGAGKSTGVAALLPDPTLFVELDLHQKDENLSRLMRGALIGELAELSGLRNREIEATKGFISRTHDQLVKKYQEFKTTYARRIVFIGTSNADDFLDDPTGARRFSPITVDKVDVSRIRRDHEQIWAQGLAMFLETGIQYAELQKRSEPVHVNYTHEDMWKDVISDWLVEEDLESGAAREEAPFIRGVDIATGALMMQRGQFNDGVAKRIGKTMRQLGYSGKVVRINGKPTRAYIKYA